jgi:hypothetical protein
VLALIRYAAGSAASKHPTLIRRACEEMRAFRLGRIDKLCGDAPTNLEKQIEGDSRAPARRG